MKRQNVLFKILLLLWLSACVSIIWAVSVPLPPWLKKHEYIEETDKYRNHGRWYKYQCEAAIGNGISWGNRHERWYKNDVKNSNNGNGNMNCGPTSVAMALYYFYGIDLSTELFSYRAEETGDPQYVHTLSRWRFCLANGFYNNGYKNSWNIGTVDNTSDFQILKPLNSVGIATKRKTGSDVTIENISKEIDSGRVVMCHVNTEPLGHGTPSHWVIAYGYQLNNSGDISYIFYQDPGYKNDITKKVLGLSFKNALNGVGSRVFISMSNPNAEAIQKTYDFNRDFENTDDDFSDGWLCGNSDTKRLTDIIYNNEDKNKSFSVYTTADKASILSPVFDRNIFSKGAYAYFKMKIIDDELEFELKGERWIAEKCTVWVRDELESWNNPVDIELANEDYYYDPDGNGKYEFRSGEYNIYRIDFTNLRHDLEIKQFSIESTEYYKDGSVCYIFDWLKIHEKASYIVSDSAKICSGISLNGTFDKEPIEFIDNKNILEGNDIYCFTELRNVYLSHKFKTKLYKKNSSDNFFEIEGVDRISEWRIVDNFFGYSHFYPSWDDLEPGDYKFKTYVDIVSGNDETADDWDFIGESEIFTIKSLGSNIPKPENVDAVRNDGVHNVTWNFNSSQVASYKVIREIPALNSTVVIATTSNNSCSDINACLNTTYRYKVIAQVDGNESSPSDPAEIVVHSNGGTGSGIYPAENLSFIVQSDNRVALSWNKGLNPSGTWYYEVNECVGNDVNTANMIGFVNVDNFMTNVLSEGDHYFSVRVEKDGHISDYSELVKVTIGNDDDPNPIKPNPVNNLFYGVLSDSQIKLIWDAGDNNESTLDYFKIYQSSSNSFDNATQINQVDRYNTEYIVNGLSSGVNYYFFVVITNKDGGDSNPVSVSANTNTASGANGFVTDALMMGLNGSISCVDAHTYTKENVNTDVFSKQDEKVYIRFAFTDVPANTNFKIVWENPSFEKIYETQNIPTTGDCSVFEIKSWIDISNSNDVGIWDVYAYVTNSAQGIDDYCPGGFELKLELDSPSALQATEVQAKQVSLAWQGVNDASSYEIYRDEAKVGSSGSNTFTDNTATPETVHAYKVRAKNGIVVSGFSSSISVTTPEAKTILDSVNIYAGKVFLPDVNKNDTLELVSLYRDWQTRQIGLEVRDYGKNVIDRFLILDSSFVPKDIVLYPNSNTTFPKVIVSVLNDSGVVEDREYIVEIPVGGINLFNPGNLNVQANSYTGMDLVWNPSPYLKDLYYEVYQATSSDSSQAQKIGETSDTVFSDNGLVPGTDYYYFLKTCSNGGTTDLSSAYLGKTDSLKAPNGLVADEVTGLAIKLSWQTVSNVIGYEVYRNGSFYAEVSTNNFSDSNIVLDEVYDYSVLAYIANYNSPNSPDVQVITPRIFVEPVKNYADKMFLYDEENTDIALVGENVRTGEPIVHIREYLTNGESYVFSPVMDSTYQALKIGKFVDRNSDGIDDVIIQLIKKSTGESVDVILDPTNGIVLETNF